MYIFIDLTHEKFVTYLHFCVRESDRWETFGTGIVKMTNSVTYGILYILISFEGHSPPLWL